MDVQFFCLGFTTRLSLGPQQTEANRVALAVLGSVSRRGETTHLLTQQDPTNLVGQKNVCPFPKVTTPNFSPVSDAAVREHSTGPSRGKSRVERLLGQVQTEAVQGSSTFPILSQH